MARVSKAGLASKLRKAKIPIPSDATVSDLEYRLKHWLSPNGFLVRKFRHSDAGPTRYLDYGVNYWIPDSVFAKEVLESKKVFCLGRETTVTNSATFLDVPESYGEEE